MRIQQVKISGFRPIPFCAQADFDADPVTITWDDDAFTVTFPTGFGAVDRDEINWEDEQIQASGLEEDETPKLLSTMIGANSSGKSSVLYALELFFSSSTKVEEEFIHNWEKNPDKKVIIEVTTVGVLETLDEWHKKNCEYVTIERPNDQSDAHLCKLTVARVWTQKSNSYNRYILEPESGNYKKESGRGEGSDRDWCTGLWPKYRLIPADSKLDSEINPDRSGTLMKDLFDKVLERSQQDEYDSAVNQMASLLVVLNEILDREQKPQSSSSLLKKLLRKRFVEGQEKPVVKNMQPHFDHIDAELDVLQQALDQASQTQDSAKDYWEEVRRLEKKLASVLSSVNPNAKVNFDFSNSDLSVNKLFSAVKLSILDGVELPTSEHGLGMQRSFLVATLNAWCEYVGHQTDDQNYLFAIEEPEIYLHPHAIRVMINTLETIGRQDQVIFTTHSNEFANRVPLENITILRRDGTKSCAAKPDLSEVDPKDLVKVRRYMVEDRSDMLFARSVVLVEGQSELFALPSFARKLGYEIDRLGISIVFVGGKGNFQHYHRILVAFDIPHIILGDGDKDPQSHRQKYERWFSKEGHVYVLEKDFEYLVAKNLTKPRLWRIIEVCRNLRDITEDLDSTYLDITLEEKAKRLENQGKPLVGRVLGDELTREEIKRMEIVTKILKTAIKLANPSSSETQA